MRGGSHPSLLFFDNNSSNEEGILVKWQKNVNFAKCFPGMRLVSPDIN